MLIILTTRYEGTVKRSAELSKSLPRNNTSRVLKSESEQIVSDEIFTSFPFIRKRWGNCSNTRT